MTTTPEHSISALCQRSRDISLEKGWLNPDGSDPRPFYTVIALFHSELSEAFEEVRNNKKLDDVYYEVKVKEDDDQISMQSDVSAAALVELKKLEWKYGRGRDFLDAKPCGIPIELADFVIRVCQWAGSNGHGEALRVAVEARLLEDEAAESIEVLVSDLHLQVSWAYQPDRHVPGAPSSLEHLGGALGDVFVFCERNNVDLWAAIDEKEAYNRTRPIRHGNKAC